MTGEICTHFSLSKESCAGCVQWDKPAYSFFKKKVDDEIKKFFQIFGYQPPQIILLRPQSLSYRTKWDIQARENNVGLLNQKGQVISTNKCLLLTPNLYQFFKEIEPVLQGLFHKASLRLRVGPLGEKALWVDTSHLETEFLFKNKQTELKELTQMALVEWGQRKKPLVFDGDKPQLKKRWEVLPTLFRTWIQESPFDLGLHVGDFTQPSFETNYLMIQCLQEELKKNEFDQVHEFGCGIGNMSFVLSQYTSHLHCYEWDSFALESFNFNKERFLQIYKNKLNSIYLHHKDARHTKSNPISQVQGALFLNPSRSGVGDFLTQFHMNQVEKLIYLSCFPESFYKDLVPIKNQKKCETLVFIDQFPQSAHLEMLSFWT